MRTREDILRDRITVNSTDIAEQHLYTSMASNHKLLEVLLDLRDQNERIIELLSQDHSHETRMLASGEIVNVVKRMRHES